MPALEEEEEDEEDEEDEAEEDDEEEEEAQEEEEEEEEDDGTAVEAENMLPNPRRLAQLTGAGVFSTDCRARPGPPFPTRRAIVSSLRPARLALDATPSNMENPPNPSDSWQSEGRCKVRADERGTENAETEITPGSTCGLAPPC